MDLSLQIDNKKDYIILGHYPKMTLSDAKKLFLEYRDGCLFTATIHRKMPGDERSEEIKSSQKQHVS